MHTEIGLTKKTIVLVLALVLGLLAGCNDGTLSVLTTNDSHSHLLGDPVENYNPTVTGDGTQGGAARVAAIIDQAREANENLMAFSAGDFIDGTIFITGEDGAADLNLLSAMGFTAACIGNHEMSMSPDGLADMILKAQKPMLPLVCANFTFSQDDTPLGHSDDRLEALHSETELSGKYIFDYIIRTTPSGLKVGIFGLIGQDVLMPDAAPVKFKINNLKIQTLVNKLRYIQKVDVVICLMHASFDVDADGVASGEVADLAKNVRGIDLICSGHAHTLGTAKVAYWATGNPWTTTIMEAGDEFKYVDKADLTVEDGVVDTSLTQTRIIPVDDTIIASPSVHARVDSLIADIETNYLTRYPALSDGKIFSTLAHADFTFGRLNSMNLVTDAMRGFAGTDVAICTPGADTAEILARADGSITVYDAFYAMPHSMGRDGTPGGPLYKFNLKGSELLSLFELGTCFLGQLTSDLFVVPSGLKIVFDTDRLLGKRIKQMYAISADESTQTLLYDSTDPKYLLTCGWIADPQHLYSVSASQLVLIGVKYVTELLPFVDLWPRDENGAQVRWETLADLDQFIVQGTDPVSGDTYEVKAWYGLSQWLLNLPEGSIPLRFSDDTTVNPVGPPWRRVWNTQKYGEPN